MRKGHWPKLAKEAAIASEYYLRRGNVRQAVFFAEVSAIAQRNMKNAS